MAGIEYKFRLTAEGWQADAGAAAVPASPVPQAALPQPRLLTSGARGPALAPAAVLCWDDFLPQGMRDEVFAYICRDTENYAPSQVYRGSGTYDVVPTNRKSLARREDPWIRARMTPVLEAPMRVARRFFGMEDVPFGKLELQTVGSGEGDFFVMHCDDSAEALYARMLTFIYYLHRHPRPFSGGMLRVFDSERRDGAYVVAATCADVEPRDNRLVMFPSDRFHEVARVDGATPEFADRRITINGWFWAEDGVLPSGQFAAPPADA